MLKASISLALLASGVEAVSKSAGCGSATSKTIGSTYSDSITAGGVERTFTVFVPEDYDYNTPKPLIFSIHGWGGTSLEDSCDSGLTAVAKNTSGYIVAHLQGMQDYPKGNAANWGAWHFNASCQNGGTSCDTSQHTDQYCYESNTDCQDCDWTSCYDDVAYIDELYDVFEQEFCIDTDMEFATGQSNGGMMTYQLGASLSDRLAAIAPISGSMHWTHVVKPESPIPVLAVTGSKDTSVPGNGTANGKTTDGTWWYNSMQHLADLWTDAQGGDGVSSHYETSFDGVHDLWCKSVHSNIDHVLCSWNGKHNYYGGVNEKYIYTCNPENLEETYYENGFLVWEFFQKQSKASH